MRRLFLLPLVLSIGCTCGAPGGGGGNDDDGPGGCSDQDHDGFGVGADCDGPDCDDANPSVWTDEQCEAACASDPQSTGCPCDSASFPEPVVCFTGAPEALGVGPCTGGLRMCDGASWG